MLRKPPFTTATAGLQGGYGCKVSGDCVELVRNIRGMLVSASAKMTVLAYCRLPGKARGRSVTVATPGGRSSIRGACFQGTAGYPP
jgi:hypothetical protein